MPSTEKSNGPEYAGWLEWVYRRMLTLRGITITDLAREMGIPRTTASSLLKGGPGRAKDQYAIEEAIGAITEARGGLPAVTGATKAGLDAIPGEARHAFHRSLMGSE